MQWRIEFDDGKVCKETADTIQAAVMHARLSRRIEDVLKGKEARHHDVVKAERVKG
jgi:hypothetical protein